MRTSFAKKSRFLAFVLSFALLCSVIAPFPAYAALAEDGLSIEQMISEIVAQTGNAEVKKTAERLIANPNPAAADAYVFNGVASAFALTVSPGNTAYYVDAVGGDDTNDGTSEAQAWKSIEKVNSVTFAPGDRILFKAGAAWTVTTTLQPKGSGIAGNPIKLGSYGSGNKPLLKGSGVEEVILLYNVEYWEISGLEITNELGNGFDRTASTSSQSNGALLKNQDRRGIRVAGQDAGTLNYFRIHDMYIHWVEGDVKWIGGSSTTPGTTAGAGWDASKRTGGILIEGMRPTTSPKVASQFNDIIIENNVFVDNSFCSVTVKQWNGNAGTNEYWAQRDSGQSQGPPNYEPSTWKPHTNIIIQDNYLDHRNASYACDTIYVTSTQHAVIQRNFSVGAGTCGIELYYTDDVVIQYNEVCETMQKAGGSDKNGIDPDKESTNALIQYNYIHGSGEGILLCGFTFGSSIVRYNVLTDIEGNYINPHADRGDYLIYNNIFYNTSGSAYFVRSSGSQATYLDSNNLRYYLYNNIFYNSSGTAATIGTGRSMYYDNNAYIGNAAPPATSPSTDANPVKLAIADTPFAEVNLTHTTPQSSDTVMARLATIKLPLKSTSPLTGGGREIPTDIRGVLNSSRQAFDLSAEVLAANYIKKDLAGRTLPDARMSIGAFEYVGTDSAKETVSGIVRDEYGNRLPGATVKIEDTAFTAVTDASGFFAIPEVPFGAYAVTVSKADYDSSTRTGVAVAQGNITRLDLTIGACHLNYGYIEGKVLDTRGVAVAGVTVSASNGSGGPFTAVTIADGTYKITEVPVGTGYTVTPEKEYYSGTAKTGVEVIAGFTVIADFTLTALAPPVEVAGVSVHRPSFSLTLGGAVQLQAVITPDNAANKAVLWEIDEFSAGDFVELGADGLVTAKALGGPTVIRVTTQDGSYQDECVVWVVAEDVAATGVAVSPDVYQFRSDYFSRTSTGSRPTTQLYANVLSYDDVTKSGDGGVSTYTLNESGATNHKVVWASSNPAAATVDPATGVVTAIAGGRTVITATSEDGSFVGSALVYVPSLSESFQNRAVGTSTWTGLTTGVGTSSGSGTLGGSVVDVAGDGNRVYQVSGGGSGIRTLAMTFSPTYNPGSSGRLLIDVDWNIGSPANGNGGFHLSFENGSTGSSSVQNRFLVLQANNSTGQLCYTTGGYTTNSAISGLTNLPSQFTGTNQTYNVKLWINYDSNTMDLTVTRKNNPSITTTIKGITKPSAVSGGFARLQFTMTRSSDTTWTTWIDNLNVYSYGVETYAVDYDANGGTGTAPTVSPKAAGEKFAAAAETVFTAPAGKMFKEWNTKSDGTGTAYAPGEDITMPAQALTVYAIWKDLPVTPMPVTYDGNGAAGDAPTQADTVPGESFNAAVNTFTPPANKRFKEWNTAANGSGTGYAEGAAITMPGYALTLYAIWDDILYTLAYDANGGTGNAPASTQRAAGAVIDAARRDTFKAPEGKMFKEWNTKDDGTGTGYAGSYTTNASGALGGAGKITMPGKDVTLYAIWVELPNELLLYDDFSSYEKGSFASTSSGPVAWSVFVGNSANGSVQIVEDPEDPANQVLYMNKTANTDVGVYNTNSLDARGVVTIEARVRRSVNAGTNQYSIYSFNNQQGDWNTATPASSANPMATMFLNGANIGSHATRGTSTVANYDTAFALNRWYTIQVVADLTGNGTYKFYVDGVLKSSSANDPTLRTMREAINRMLIYSSSSNLGDMYLDYIKVYAGDPVDPTVEVTLDYNGGEGDVESVTLLPGEPYGELPSPSRAGYLFEGWSIDGTVEGVVKADDIVPEGITTLTAVWSVDPKVYVKVAGPAFAALSDEIEYVISVANAKKLATATIWFEVDGATVAGGDMAALAEDFGEIGGITWALKEGTESTYIGRITLGNLKGGSLTDVDYVDLFSAKLGVLDQLEKLDSYGDTTFKLTRIDLSGYDADGSAVFFEAVEIVNDTVTTEIVYNFSPYDLNKDKVVDQLDLTIAQKYYMAAEGDAGWDEAKIADVNGSGKVDIEDFILFLNNIVW